MQSKSETPAEPRFPELSGLRFIANEPGKPDSCFAAERRIRAPPTSHLLRAGLAHVRGVVAAEARRGDVRDAPVAYGRSTSHAVRDKFDPPLPGPGVGSHRVQQQGP